MERKTLRFDIKGTSGDGSTGEGIGAAFHNVDTYREIIAPGSFTSDLPDFLADGFIGGLNHDWDNPIGSPTDAKEVAAGLWLSWAISDTSHGRDVKTLLKDKVVKKLSIGFETVGSEYLENADEVKAYWDKHKYEPSAQDLQRSANGSVRLLTRINLFEVSPVVVPANDKAIITAVKAADIKTLRDLETYLREQTGLSRSQAERHAAVLYKALQGEPDGAKDEETQGGKPASSSSISLLTETERLRTQFKRSESRLRSKGVLCEI
jgi:HK97 family phage prohead protease